MRPKTSALLEEVHGIITSLGPQHMDVLFPAMNLTKSAGSLAVRRYGNKYDLKITDGVVHIVGKENSPEVLAAKKRVTGGKKPQRTQRTATHLQQMATMLHTFFAACEERLAMLDAKLERLDQIEKQLDALLDYLTKPQVSSTTSEPPTPQPQRSAVEVKETKPIVRNKIRAVVIGGTPPEKASIELAAARVGIKINRMYQFSEHIRDIFIPASTDVVFFDRKTGVEKFYHTLSSELKKADIPLIEVDGVKRLPDVFKQVAEQFASV